MIIETFEGQKEDKALLNLIPFLKELAKLDDVRHVDARYLEYQSKKLKESAELKEQHEKEKQELAKNQEIESEAKSEESTKLDEEEISGGKENKALQDIEPVSGLSIATTVDAEAEEASKDSPLKRKAKGFYQSLVRMSEVV